MKAYYFDNGTDENPEWSNNWGDIIGPEIVRHFSQSSKIEPTDQKVNGKLVSIGSVMLAVRNNDLIWGTGIIQSGQHLPNLRNVKIFATRGPMTRDRLIDLGHKVPEVYGDPGLLYPHIYNPEIKKTHKWGIIPHYVDVNHPMVKHLVNKGVKFIDICAGKKEFVDQLKSVDNVLSSSLHGLIAADAYGIPNARIKLTGNLVGGDFKFRDYSLSVNRLNWKAVEINKETIIEEIELNHSIEWDEDELLQSAPWNHEKYRDLF